MGTLFDKITSLYDWVSLQTKRYYAYSIADRQDLASETMLHMLEHSGSFDEKKDLKAWAFVIMRNIFRTEYSRRLCVEFERLDRCTNDDLLVDEDVNYSSTSSFIRRMSKKNINVQCLVFLSEGYSYSDIASMLNIPIGTVKSRVNTGRRLMRKALCH